MLFALLYCIIVSDRESKKTGLESPGDFVYLSAAAAAVSAIAEADEEYGDNYNPKALVIKKIAKAVHILFSAVRSESEPFPFIIIYQGIRRRFRLHTHIHAADTARMASPLTSERFLRSDIMLCKG